MMRQALALICCLSLVAPSLAAAAPRARAARPAATAPRDESGTLVLICTVDGAEFVIDEDRGDDAIRDVTPVTRPIRLPAGTHTLRVSREGYLPFSEVFDIAPGEATELEADLVLYSGTLKVVATPAGVQVQVDGTVQGEAPVEARVSIGEHVVRLSRAGYVDEVRRVAVKTGQVTELAVKLVPMAEAERAATKSAFWKQWWFWTVVGGAVAGAVGRVRSSSSGVSSTRPYSTFSRRSKAACAWAQPAQTIDRSSAAAAPLRKGRRTRFISLPSRRRCARVRGCAVAPRV